MPENLVSLRRESTPQEGIYFKAIRDLPKGPSSKETKGAAPSSPSDKAKLQEKVQGGSVKKEVPLPKAQKFSFGSTEKGFTEYSFYKPTNVAQLNKLKTEGFVAIRKGNEIGFMNKSEAADYFQKNPNAEKVKGEVKLFGGKLVETPAVKLAERAPKSAPNREVRMEELKVRVNPQLALARP